MKKLFRSFFTDLFAVKKNITIALITSLFVVGMFYGSKLFIESKIDSFLKKEINQKLGKGYSFTYHDSQWKVFDGSISVIELVLEKKSSDSSEWKVEVEQTEMFGFNIIPFISKSIFRVDSVLIYSPNVKITNFNSRESKHRASDVESDKILKITFGKISLQKGILLYDPGGAERLETKLNFETTNFSIDEGAIGNVLTWQNAEVILQDINYQFRDSIYKATIDQLSYSSKSGEFTLLNSHLSSILNITDFSNYHGWRKAMFTADVPKIVIHKPVNYTDSIGFIPKILIVSPHLCLEKDLSFPLPNRITELPQAFLSNSSVCLGIDSVQVLDGHFKVEITHQVNSKSKLIFSHIDARLVGIQNTNPQDAAFNFQADAQFMDKASLRLETSYNYGSLNPFMVSGKLETISVTFMDEFLRRSAGVELADGTINELTFDMKGNTFGVSGAVEMYYNDLELKIVDKNTKVEKKFLSKMAELFGGLIFWKDNPDKNQFRKGTIENERDERKGFVAQWVDGLLDGIINTILRINPEKLEHTKQKTEEKKSG